MKGLLFALSLTLLNIAPVKAESFPIEDRLKTFELYLDLYPHLFKDPLLEDHEEFTKALHSLRGEEKEQAFEFIDTFDPFLPPQYLKALITHRYLKPNQEVFEKVLSYLFFEKVLIIRDAIDSPRTSNPLALQNVLRTITEHSELTSENTYSILYPLLQEKAHLISAIKDPRAFLDALKSTDILRLDLGQIVDSNTLYLLDPLGIVPGNRVELIEKNETSLARMNWLNERLIFEGGELDLNAPYIEIPFKPGQQGHPVFRNDPIFQKLRDMLAKAQRSIFIDIFMLGGTIGASLTEYLIKLTKLNLKKNPDFNVLILHDFEMTSTYEEEILPVFNYLKEQLENDPILAEHISLVQSNIHHRKPGIPFSRLNLKNPHYHPQNDHSRVLVVDGNSLNPSAYFGSKDWIDHPGGFSFDSMLYVEGPAAALVQASYIRDLKAALTKNPSKKEKLVNKFTITEKQIPFAGNTSLRLAQTDVTSQIRNPRNILLDMIIHAKDNIYMDQHFLYDHYIVDALIKKKLENPKIDIKIILDNNLSYGLNGLPNTIFLDELLKSKIEVRFRKTHSFEAKAPNGLPHTSYQLNHRKVTSVDGQELLIGSFSYSPDALQGSFREFGAQVFSEVEADAFESRFLKDWNNPEALHLVDIKNFQANIEGRYLNKKSSSLINDMGALLLRSKLELEKSLDAAN